MKAFDVLAIRFAEAGAEWRAITVLIREPISDLLPHSQTFL